MFESYDQKQGPHHGLPVSTPYVTKDHLQVTTAVKLARQCVSYHNYGDDVCFLVRAGYNLNVTRHLGILQFERFLAHLAS